MKPRTIKGPEISQAFNELSLGQFFFKMALKHGDKIAQVDSITDAKESFNSIRKRSVRVAIEMKNRGITSKDVIVFCTINCLDNIIPIVAASYLGAKIASLDPTLILSHIKHLMNLVKPSLIFVEDKSIDLIEQAIENFENKPQIVTFGASLKYPSLQDFTKFNENEDNFEPIEISPNDPAIIFFTSGTTGLPKAICVSSRSVLHYIDGFPYRRVNLDVVVHFSTLYWISGIATVVASFFSGGYRVIFPQFDEENTLRAIEKYKITFITTIHTLAYKLAHFKNFAKFDVSSLSDIAVGATPISPSRLQEIRKAFKNVNVFVAYGLTEGGFIAYFDPKRDYEFLQTKLQSCGKVAPGVTVKIINTDTGELLPPHKNGELCVKSPAVMLGYYNGENSQVLDDEGYLKTGDIAYYDEDDYIYIVDRIKDVFKYQSWHIVPSLVENVLLEHPAISEACVFGIPHDLDGALPAAWVVLKDGMSATIDDITEFVAQRVLDREKLRGGVTIVQSLPKTATGKLTRKEALRQMIQSMEAARS